VLSLGLVEDWFGMIFGFTVLIQKLRKFLECIHCDFDSIIGGVGLHLVVKEQVENVSHLVAGRAL